MISTMFTTMRARKSLNVLQIRRAVLKTFVHVIQNLSIRKLFELSVSSSKT